MTNEKNEFRILSLDGGGSWSLIQAIALADFYGLGTNGIQILNKFDLVVANSGGSIVLGGLIMGMTPSEIFRLFNNEAIRKEIFDDKWSKRIGYQKYSTQSKLTGLTQAFSDYPKANLKNLKDLRDENRIKPDIIICAFDCDRERAKFFRSNHNSKAASFRASAASGLVYGTDSATLIQAMHASSTAPVRFFDDPAQMDLGDVSYNFWDGAIAGYNNPILAGITDAICNHPEVRNDIIALSIGTGSIFLPLSSGKHAKPYLYKKNQNLDSFPNDIILLAHAIINDPPDAASFIAHVLLNGKLPTNKKDRVTDGSIIRINPLVQPFKDTSSGQWVINKPNQIKVHMDFEDDEFRKLTELELDAIEKYEVHLIKNLTWLWLEDRVKNQPIRANEDFECEIGHAFYSDARNAWPGCPFDPNNRYEIMDLLRP